MFVPQWYGDHPEDKQKNIPVGRLWPVDGKPIPVYHIQEQVMAVHKCSRAGPGTKCEVRNVCSEHRRGNCPTCSTSERHMVHNWDHKVYYLVSHANGFTREAQQFNVDWLTKI